MYIYNITVYESNDYKNQFSLARQRMTNYIKYSVV